MNKEYLYLSNEYILVIDEKGHAIKRTVESTDMHDVLLLENDLEKINEAITKLEKTIQQDEKNKLSTKEKIIFACSPFIVGASAFSVSCLFVPVSLSNIIPVIIGLALGTVIFDGVVILSTKHHVKHINGTKNKLLTAYQLKENLEQKLSNIKDKSKDSITANIAKSHENNLQANDVVVLEETSPFCEEASKQLENAYMAGYDQKRKKLILKK